MLDLPIDLGKGFLAAHREHGMPEGHEDAEEPEVPHETAVLKEAEGVITEVQVRRTGQRGKVRSEVKYGVDAP